MAVYCECCVLSDRDLWVELITHPEDFYWVWCVWVWSWWFNNEGCWPTGGCCGKFQNARQVRTGPNIVKFSSLNTPSTSLIFRCLRTHAKTPESLTFIRKRERERERVHFKCTVECTENFIVNLFNVGNVLLCVIYQLNFTVFLYVTRISYYSVRYYPRFHVTAVGLGTYYPWKRGHYCNHNPKR
jgi:hypothetical protein